ncbi:unnamed protein product, partial [Mesorhabditis spiculigera]
MGLRAHAVASSDGWLRSLFWFLLICSNFGYTDQIHNFLDLPFDDPLNLSPAMLRNHHRIRRQEKDCSPGRQFICYAYDGLDEPYPEWLQNTDAKCEKCKTDSVCKDTDKVETATDDVRPQVKKSCRPNLCFNLAQELDEEGGRRVRRQSMTEQVIRYPKCIDINGLSTYDRNRVEADPMLDCRTNVFFKANGAEELKLTPPSCDGDDDVRICKGRREPTTAPTPTTAGPEDDPFLSTTMIVIIAAGASILICLPCCYGCHLIWKAIPETEPSPLPSAHFADTVKLVDQEIFGSWGAAFKEKINGKPPRMPQKQPGYAKTGHVALRVNKDTIRPTPKDQVMHLF